MKHIHTFESFLFEEKLNEIGDSLPAEWNKKSEDRRQTVYTFEMPSDTYEVLLYRDSDDRENVIVEFSANGDRSNITNSGYPLQVFITVFDIVKSFSKENPDIKKFSFTPEKNKGPNDNRREKIYMYYIKKLFPKSTYTYRDIGNSGYRDIVVMVNESSLPISGSKIGEISIAIQKNLDLFDSIAGGECHDIALIAFAYAQKSGLLTNPVIKWTTAHAWVEGTFNQEPVILDVVAVNQKHLGEPFKKAEISENYPKNSYVADSVDKYLQNNQLCGIDSEAAEAGTEELEFLNSLI